MYLVSDGYLVAILDLCVKMTRYYQTNVRIVILVLDLPEKVSLYIIIGVLVQNIICQNGDGGHFVCWPLAKNAAIFARDMGAHFFLKGS